MTVTNNNNDEILDRGLLYDFFFRFQGHFSLSVNTDDTIHHSKRKTKKK